eukprot:13259569-Alexandrium_andersonii.AAC.1
MPSRRSPASIQSCCSPEARGARLADTATPHTCAAKRGAQSARRAQDAAQPLLCAPAVPAIP